MTSEKEHSTDPRLAVLANRSAAAFLIFVILLYAGLIGLGRWQGDEYADFATFRAQGWKYYFVRIQWSPRPLSELLLCAYGWTVNQTHRHLVPAFLALVWMVFIAAGLLEFLQFRKHASRDDNWLALLAVLALMSSFLAGGKLTEIFYWPIGAAAYLLTLSGTLLLFWQVVAGRISTKAGRAISCAALMVAACSSEVGAMFVVCYALVHVLETLCRLGSSAANRKIPPNILWWLLPGILSVALLAIISLNRFHVAETGFTVATPALGHPISSAFAAVLQLGRELVGDTQSSLHPTSRLMSHILLSLAMALCGSKIFPLTKSFRLISPLIVALLGACLMSLAASYLHLGTAGGQRHEELRHCWILMCFAGAGLNLGSRYHSRLSKLHGVVRIAAPVLLLMAVASVWHVKEVFREYRAYPAVRRTIGENFRNGFNCASDQMVYVLPPDHGVLAFAQIEPGTYTRGALTPPYPAFILNYFRKRTLIVRSYHPR